MYRVSEHFCYIKKTMVIMQCEYPNRQNHSFIVYWNNLDKGCPIHINTEYHSTETASDFLQVFYRKDGIGYDRRLCSTYDELKDMTLRDLEHQAYCAWMDGAR